MHNTRPRILTVNLVVLAIGLADLITTLVWLHTGRCIEVNPVMATVLKAGMPIFALVKLSTLAAYIYVMEWYRHNRSATFAQLVGRITVTAYCAIYFVSFCLVNRGLLPV